MRLPPALRVIKRLAAAATLSLALITIVSIQVSFIVWLPSASFAGVQHGRIGWGQHVKAHGRWSLHVNADHRDLDWTATSTPPTGRAIPGLGTTPIIGMAFGGGRGGNRWIPLWWFLAPAAGAWLLLAAFDRRIKPGCCAKCGYELEGVPKGDEGVTCPECGANAAES